MPNKESSLRAPPVVTDDELLASMGTDPVAWATEFQKVLPGFGGFYNANLGRAWFHHAIEAGRKAGLAEAKAQPSEPAPFVVQCSFCGAPEEVMEHLVHGSAGQGNAFICDTCIPKCGEVVLRSKIRAEIGVEMRKQAR